MPPRVHVVCTDLRYLPIETRVPLKFGPETVDCVTCARVRMEVSDEHGRRAVGWGETPLSVQWVWPSTVPYSSRFDRLQQLTEMLAEAWTTFEGEGHALEVGYDFQEQVLPELNRRINEQCGEDTGPVPHLAALVCCSPFDIALHDAYANLLGCGVYETYGAVLLHRDLSSFVKPARDTDISFKGRYPDEFLSRVVPERLAAWHLVGGLDPLDAGDCSGDEPDDGYPVLLGDWIDADGLKCLKIKLRGNDAAWDYERTVAVGRLAIDRGVVWLSADFNCTVSDPEYVNEVLDRLRDDEPRIFGMLLYVEQPFPYDLEANRIDVRSVSARKPLFMDESAHDWRLIDLGRSLGWSGVALKTCKTQTGALLSLCWARAHGMPLMVQDLTNPMLAQIPHVRLAAHAGTIMGVETNSMQFYPDASLAEEQVHPGIYRRRDGNLDLTSLGDRGFGYRVDMIERSLPEPAARFER
ncbi:MAG: hypothetical protein CMJ18_10855 [Phycisphaeraceae bacterium]|nr:hypothetical protein [Phycisphaeraceae bacterium]